MSDWHDQQPQVQHFLPFSLLLNNQPVRLDLIRTIQQKQRAETRFVMFVKIAKLDAPSCQNLQRWCDLSIKLCWRPHPQRATIAHPDTWLAGVTRPHPSMTLIGWSQHTAPVCRHKADWIYRTLTQVLFIYLLTDFFTVTIFLSIKLNIFHCQSIMCKYLSTSSPGTHALSKFHIEHIFQFRRLNVVCLSVVRH